MYYQQPLIDKHSIWGSPQRLFMIRMNCITFVTASVSELTVTEMYACKVVSIHAYIAQIHDWPGLKSRANSDLIVIT